LKFYYKKGKNATQTAKKIFDVYDAVYDDMMQYQYMTQSKVQAFSIWKF